MYILKYNQSCFSTLNNIRIKITKMAAMTAEHLLCVNSCKYSAYPPQ